MEFHPHTFLFPEIDPKHYQELKDDIQAHGLIEPITTYCGRILDGRHRYKICQELKIELMPDNFVEFIPTEKVSLVDFVVSKNQMRRHLSAREAAVAAAKIAAAYRDEGKLKREGNLQKGASPKSPIGEIGTPKINSIKRAALATGISERTTSRALHISDNFPALFGKIENGEISVHAAEQAAKAEAKKYAPADEEPEPETGDQFIDEWKKKHKELRGIREEIRLMLVRMKAIDPPIRAHLCMESIESHLNGVMYEIHASAPDKKCPYCRGKGCKYCNEAGWITKSMFDRLPKEMKK
jgi:ParB-like chromosome segregation protein Spo0J